MSSIAGFVSSQGLNEHNTTDFTDLLDRIRPRESGLITVRMYCTPTKGEQHISSHASESLSEINSFMLSHRVNCVGITNPTTTTVLAHLAMPDGLDWRLGSAVESRMEHGFGGAVLFAGEINNKDWPRITDGTRGHVKSIKKARGGFALVSVDAHNPHTLIMANTYRPLFMYRRENELWFSSRRGLEDALGFAGKAMPFEHEPYTITQENVTHSTEIATIGKRERKKSRVVILASGGLESSVSAKMACDAVGAENVLLLHIDTPITANKREWQAVRMLADRLGCWYDRIDMRKAMKKTAHSSTVVGDPEDNAYRDPWIPMRNSMFFLVACAYAEDNDYDQVWFGGTYDSAFPDGGPELTMRLQPSLPYFTGERVPMQVYSPVAKLLRHEIIAVGAEIGAPLEITWSCYHPIDGKHCGGEPCCARRKEAFKRAGVPDPTEYAS